MYKVQSYGNYIKFNQKNLILVKDLFGGKVLRAAQASSGLVAITTGMNELDDDISRGRAMLIDAINRTTTNDYLLENMSHRILCFLL